MLSGKVCGRLSQVFCRCGGTFAVERLGGSNISGDRLNLVREKFVNYFLMFSTLKVLVLLMTWTVTLIHVKQCFLTCVSQELSRCVARIFKKS